MTGIYALVHMAVDLSCAFLVYTYVLGGEQWYLWLLLYNFCAFALQMPIGAAADRLDRNSCVAVGGCAGVLAGLLLGIVGFPAGAAVVAGIGNACFHVGGGIDVLNRSERRRRWESLWLPARWGYFWEPCSAGPERRRLCGSAVF